TAAGADWQIHGYGTTLHAFTNPEANAPDMGAMYKADADRRSWQAMENFLAEVLN
ncbi:MAG: dienelactone hydrolase family protein, partial [Pseudomonadota bacterium]|nr:dienelactone hydrolase family protein [Pseudomonadota bacterium]